MINRQRLPRRIEVVPLSVEVGEAGRVGCGREITVVVNVTVFLGRSKQSFSKYLPRTIKLE